MAIRYDKKNKTLFSHSFREKLIFIEKGKHKFLKNNSEVRWMSGWNQRFAKPSYGSNRTGGSNPPLTANTKKSLIIFLLLFLFIMNGEGRWNENEFRNYPREVVQPGRIHGLGPWGRRFESCPPD